MPPRVTNCVPGETGTNQPRRRNTRFSSSSDTPASARNSPEAGSKLSSRSASVVSATGKSARAGSDESP